MTSLLNHHAHVLLCLYEDPHMRIREIARRTGSTDRSVQTRLADLEAAGLIRRSREGRRNVYELDVSRRLSHPLENGSTLGDLLRAFTSLRHLN